MLLAKYHLKLLQVSSLLCLKVDELGTRLYTSDNTKGPLPRLDTLKMSKVHVDLMQAGKKRDLMRQ